MMISNAEKKPLLRVILFGTDKLNENFSDPLLDYHADIVRRTLELGPFDREQTAHYILHRLSAAQFAANEPFTDAALHKLHRQAAGWPRHSLTRPAGSAKPGRRWLGQVRGCHNPLRG